MSKKKVAPAEQVVENIVHSAMDELMGDRFDIYAKDVIQDRAIPDARDGMKPVQRRIIYAMYKTNNTIDHPTKKCAHIVGEVMGKYHPHGDSSIYDALVRMSQDWNVRVPLIDFQGNNGSMDGDGPAAYRYTEARLAAISNELVRDIDKDTVDMGLTFDDTEFEPTVLPSRFPNLLVNGAKGIAVGLATEIPPHNLGEVIDAVIYRIQHPSCPIETLMRFVPGPDFPTGGVIYQSQGLQDIYLTGRGRIDVQAAYHIEENDGVTEIIITEVPYGVVKSQLVFAIDKIRHDKAIDGIDEVRDETDKNGVRIAIDLKPNFKPEAILAYLMGKTQMRTSYSANMVAIVDGRPTTLDLLTYCDTYIAHQKDVIVRRSNYELKKDKARLEIVEGLIKAASIISEVIAIIRRSLDKSDSKLNLQKELGFTENQSEAIVMMPLYKLSHTDVQTYLDERDALNKDIARLNEILSSEEVLNKVIISDLRLISKTYGTPRRTKIEEENTDLRSVDKRDLIASEDCMVTVTRDGYIKRCSMASYKGSNGHNGALPGVKDGDTLVYSGQCLTTDCLLMFTNKGNYLYVPVHLMKEVKWLNEGFHANYIISLPADEKIVKAFAVRTFRDDLNVVLVSRDGQIKRTRLSAFPVVRYSRPIRAMRILGEDELIDAAITSGNDNILLFSGAGGKDENCLACLYNENEISLSSTSSAGVKAASFRGKTIAAMVTLHPEENDKILLVTKLGVTRVFSTNNIELGSRLSKSTVIFKSFKKEPQELVFAARVNGREAPLSFKATLDDGSYADITFPDLNLTPMDKYAKCEGRELPKGTTIAAIAKMDSDLIDENTIAIAPPLVEVPAEEEVASRSSDSIASETITVEGDEDKPTEKFEQISIFGDDDF